MNSLFFNSTKDTFSNVKLLKNILKKITIVS